MIHCDKAKLRFLKLWYPPGLGFIYFFKHEWDLLLIVTPLIQLNSLFSSSMIEELIMKYCCFVSYLLRHDFMRLIKLCTARDTAKICSFSISMFYTKLQNDFVVKAEHRCFIIVMRVLMYGVIFVISKVSVVLTKGVLDISFIIFINNLVKIISAWSGQMGVLELFFTKSPNSKLFSRLSGFSAIRNC